MRTCLLAVGGVAPDRCIPWRLWKWGGRAAENRRWTGSANANGGSGRHGGSRSRRRPAIDPEGRSVTISHDPIPEIGWSAMTMAFAADAAIDLSTMKAGDNVHFMLKPAGEGSYRLTAACRIQGDMQAYKTAMKAMMDGDGNMRMMSMDMQGGMVMPCAEPGN